MPGQGALCVLSGFKDSLPRVEIRGSLAGGRVKGAPPAPRSISSFASIPLVSMFLLGKKKPLVLTCQNEGLYIWKLQDNPK